LPCIKRALPSSSHSSAVCWPHAGNNIAASTNRAKISLSLVLITLLEECTDTTDKKMFWCHRPMMPPNRPGENSIPAPPPPRPPRRREWCQFVPLLLLLQSQCRSRSGPPATFTTPAPEPWHRRRLPRRFCQELGGRCPCSSRPRHPRGPAR